MASHAFPSEAPDLSSLGFDPTQFTTATLQTEGWIRFNAAPDQVFARLADHEGMTDWLPLLSKVTVVRPEGLATGEDGPGVTRTLHFHGGITLVEQVVYWNPPLCYSYDTSGTLFPMDNYIGMMGVLPGQDGGGTFVFREYFELQDRPESAIIPHGVVLAMKQAFGRLSKLIDGTEYDVWHVTP